MNHPQYPVYHVAAKEAYHPTAGGRVGQPARWYAWQRHAGAHGLDVTNDAIGDELFGLSYWREVAEGIAGHKGNVPVGNGRLQFARLHPVQRHWLFRQHMFASLNSLQGIWLQ